MKIVSTGKTLASPEFYRKKQQERRTRLMVLVFGLMVIVSTLIFLSRLQHFRISAVKVEGARVISKEDVERAARENLSGYYFWLVPRNNMLLYSDDDLEATLRKTFPRFNTIGLSLNGFKELGIVVTEREPFALYCGIETSAQNSSVCYFLDNEGFIFDVAPSFSDGVYFVYASEEPKENPRGQEFLPAPDFKNLVNFVENLRGLGFKPLSLKMFGEYFEIRLAHDARLLIPRQNDLAHTYSNLESFLKSTEIKNQKDFSEKVSELDLRTENKVFWKVK